MKTTEVVVSQAESNLSRRVIRAANVRGHAVFKVWGNSFQRRGVSDICGSAIGGFAVSIEMKMPGKEKSTLTKQQEHWLRLVAATGSGARVGVATSFSQAMALIEGREKQDRWFAP